jgi:hypothetical protein
MNKSRNCKIEEEMGIAVVNRTNEKKKDDGVEKFAVTLTTIRLDCKSKNYVLKRFFVLIALKATLPTSNARSETSAFRSTRM